MATVRTSLLPNFGGVYCRAAFFAQGSILGQHQNFFVGSRGLFLGQHPVYLQFSEKFVADILHISNICQGLGKPHPFLKEEQNMKGAGIDDSFQRGAAFRIRYN